MIILARFRKRGIIRRAAATTVGRPLVLIVEDDVLVRMSAAEIISESGFDVVEAETADRAIAILESRPDVQVVFTDIRLPGSMDGLQLARLVQRKWPPIKVVATSGHVAIREADLPDGGIFLLKPDTPARRHRRAARVHRHDLAKRARAVRQDRSARRQIFRKRQCCCALLEHDRF